MKLIEKTVIKMSKDIEYIIQSVDKITKKIDDIFKTNGERDIEITKVKERQRIQWRLLIFVIVSILGIAFFVIKAQLT